MYITASDIKSNVITGFDLTEYLDETDQEVNDMAEKLGVSITDIVTPLHYKIKRYAITFLLTRLCQDKIGTASSDVQVDKYRDLYDLYSKELASLKPQLTYQMYTGTVNKITDRTQVYNLYRG